MFPFAQKGQMMFGKSLVYSSKEEQDWQKAKKLLEEAGISFHSWVSEEPPVGGCGSKIDIRSFGTGKRVLKEIFKIEVEKTDRKEAEKILKDQVLPVRYYGTG